MSVRLQLAVDRIRLACHAHGRGEIPSMKIKVGKSEIEAEIPILFFKEGETFIAHCPVLDLSACGATFNEADHNFYDALAIFFSECRKRGTLEKALEACGWMRHGEQMSPPQLVGERRVSLTDLQLA